MTKHSGYWIGELAWLSGAVAALVVTAPARAATLDQWQFDQTTQQLVLTLPQNVTPQYYLVAEPARIVIDLPNTEVGAVSTQQTYAGAIRQIRIAQFQPGMTRIVLELAPNTVLAPGQVELQRLEGATAGSQRWAIRPLLVTDPPNATVAGAPRAPVPAPAAPTTEQNPVATPSTPAADDKPSAAETAPATQPGSETTALPPLEPGAIEIPVELATDLLSGQPEAPAESADRPVETAENAPAPESEAEPEADPEADPEVVAENTPESEPAEAQPSRAATREPAPTPAVSTPAVPLPAPTAPVQPAPVAAIPAPTALVSAPLPVDFSAPPEPLHLATPNASAAALAVPSVGQASRVAPAPRVAPEPEPVRPPDQLSFPAPPAGGVAVPSISTVNPVAAAESSNNPAPQNQNAASRPQPSRPAPAQSVTAAAFPTPTAVATPAPVPQPVVSFGQQMPASAAAPQAAVTPAVPFGQPVLTTTPVAQPAAQAVAQPVASVPRAIPVIPFGQPLPLSNR